MDKINFEAAAGSAGRESSISALVNMGMDHKDARMLIDMVSHTLQQVSERVVGNAEAIPLHLRHHFILVAWSSVEEMAKFGRDKMQQALTEAFGENRPCD